MIQIRSIPNTSAKTELVAVGDLKVGTVFKSDHQAFGPVSGPAHDFLKMDIREQGEYYITTIHLKTGMVAHFPKSYCVEPAKVVSMVATYA